MPLPASPGGEEIVNENLKITIPFHCSIKEMKEQSKS